MDLASNALKTHAQKKEKKTEKRTVDFIIYFSFIYVGFSTMYKIM